MSTLQIVQIPILRDNYLYLAHEPTTGTTAAIDPGELRPAIEALAARGWQLTHILNTHHHPDHVGANLDLKAATGCTIVGPAAERDRIPGIDIALADGDRYPLGAAEGVVMDVPGHTSGHIAWWFADSNALFCGDTIFSIGCGRLFEGTPEQMWSSIARMRTLPPQTLVYCAHEYTSSNLRFALSIEPNHPELLARAEEVTALRAAGRPTIPTTMAQEAAANPFLRADDPVLQRAVGMEGAPPAEVFGVIRRQKDQF